MDFASDHDETFRRHVRKESLDLYNRIHSILFDAEWVNSVKAAYDIPLIPNLRCGAWYTESHPNVPAEFAYFKSTDGHTNNWSFNLRRPNLHLLPIIEHKGVTHSFHFLNCP